jgi:type I restriction enzyme M protein
LQIERTLFEAADKMRGAMDAGEYKHVALGLLFLRYVSAAFELKHAELAEEEYADPEDPEEYLAENVFWVPEPARWSRLSAISKDPSIGVEVDNAMRAIEEANPTLKDALPKVFGRESLDRGIISGLIALFSNMPMQGTRADFDMIGRVYEYCIGEFASAEGKRGGEFYTPKSVVETLVEMIEPTRGRSTTPAAAPAASSCNPSGSSTTTRVGPTTSRSSARSATTPPTASPG